MKVIALIPAFNEEKTVAEIIKGMKKYCQKVIVIDDGSSDRTAAVAAKAGALVKKNLVNKGLGYSIRKGYLEALKQGADLVVQIDADAQYNPDETPKLLQPIKEGKADMVLGSRFKGKIEKMPWAKKLGNRIGSITTSLVSGQGISDAQTGFRAMRAELLKEVSPRSDFTYVQEMIIRAKKERWRIAEVPVEFRKRAFGESRLFSSVLGYARKAALIILQVLVEYHPISFFGGFGFILCLFGLGLGLQLVDLFLRTGQIGKTPSVVLTALLIIAGLQLIFFGFIADFIKRKKFS